MTTETFPRAAEEEGVPKLGELLASPEELPSSTVQRPDDGGDEDEPEAARINPSLTCAATLMSSVAAGYASARVFEGAAAVGVAVLGAALGTGMVWLSFRTKRPALLQSLIFPLAVVAGAILVMGDASGGSANLPGLVAEALRSGGISQPPVPFDPGWRFLLVVMMAVLSGGTAAVAIALNRIKVAVFLPVPVLFGGLMAHSGEGSIIPTIVSLVLLAVALALGFGVELAREGATSARFEVRRLGRGLVSLVALVAVLGGLTQLGFLFPEASQRRVIPPERPRPAPPEPDREIFLVTSDRQLPWRIGVLDVYDGRGWLTPPFDTDRLVDLPSGTSIPKSSGIAGAPIGEYRLPTDGRPGAVRVTFRISDVRGHVVPAAANPRKVTRQGFDMLYDPRTQTLRLPEQRARKGMTYTVEAVPPPNGSDLSKAVPPPEELKEFLNAPRAPSEVAELIAAAPPGVDRFTRLQFVREKMYEKVVAKGAGQPTDVPPARVVELLAGKPGTPFEITAAEALIARWVGVPARIGYGYFGGDAKEPDVASIRPRHGATWLEAYFQGFGWVPIVGTPPRAQSSLSASSKNRNPSVKPSENLTLYSYVPVRLKSIQLIYTVVRYWAGLLIPAVLSALLAIWLYPGLVKVLRSGRRKRWARQIGLKERILVAYAAFRDAAFDLGVGHPTLTPLEFLKMVQPDKEHDELAWLVTRGLWGDLVRDLNDQDAALAEEMAASLVKRVRSLQPGMSRLMAFASRNSLRNPFTDEIPNLWWPTPSIRSRIKDRIRRVLSPLSGTLRRILPATTMILIVLLLSGCVQDVDLASKAAPLPSRPVPPELNGLTFSREASMELPYRSRDPDVLVGDALVFSVRRQTEVLGALQIVGFKRSLGEREKEARAGVLQGLGGSQFELRRVGKDLIYVQTLPEQQLFLWFPPKGSYYELLVARRDFEGAAQVFADVLAHQRGEASTKIADAPDPRRGSDG